ncbi:hypothetical protein P3875_06345 [Myroides sp. JBRI-B21084]|uniref:hypothetical protein n=1 Tax=Myroides sp. JBRI-B21084 TaxID=3119977 RepID=UPI0026E1BF31|nr:hypothetical protein [Paenimyroides cloacae]WKW45406.1 hypothetical protein P3875_06345 [Paenimyroides cloacae]
MKKILATLFLLGIATTGSAQTYTVSGSAELILSDDFNTLVKCDGDSGTCVKVTVIFDGWISRIEVPDCNIDKIVIRPSVNGTPIENLNGITPGNGDTFTIEYEPYE